MKKTLIIFILLTALIVVIKYFLSAYEITYKVSNYNIKTTYKDNRYYFELTGKHTFNFDIYRQRTIDKPLINQIKVIKGENFECIYPVIKEIETYPLCIQNEEIIDFNLIDSEELAHYKKENITIEKQDSSFSYFNNLDDTTYIALWNYKGYIIMNNKNFKNIELFEKDRYDNSLSHQIKNKIYMPNYDQTHEYNELIQLDLITQTITTIKLDYQIDYDSYIVGNIDNKLYIFDNKYSVLYEIDLKKQKTKVKSNNEKGYVKYNGKEFISCSKVEYKIDKITYNNNISSNYKYILNNGLYKTIKDNDNIQTKITNEEVSIINEYKNILYYIYDDHLFRYTPNKGSEKIFYFFELNFNKEKTVYIYNK